MKSQGSKSARRRPLSRLRKTVVSLIVVLIALGSGALALWVTPMQTVTAAGQTVQVGVTKPSWSLSGPGELDLFGQRIPTTVEFAGPVRPRLVLRRITFNDQLDHFTSGGAERAAHELENALINGWQQFFTWQVVLTGVIALIAIGALAGWLRRRPKQTVGLLVAGLLLAEAFDLGAVMVTAYTAPDRLGSINSLQQLAGGTEPKPPDKDSDTAEKNIHRVVVIGDSIAAGRGNTPVAKPDAADKACHRSQDAFAVDLATTNDWNVKNLACSGATIESGLLGPQKVGKHIIPPQMDDPAVSKADLIVVNVGANDVHWTTLLKLCAATPDCSNNIEQAFLQQQLNDFSRNLLQLFSRLQLLDRRPTVVVNQYYNPFPDTIDCLKKHGLTEEKKQSLDAELSALNAILGKAAGTAGFRTARPNFSGHGVCSDNPYVQGLDDKAPFHPTVSGQLAIALADENALHIPVAPPGDELVPVSPSATPSTSSSRSSSPTPNRSPASSGP